MAGRATCMRNFLSSDVTAALPRPSSATCAWRGRFFGILITERPMADDTTKVGAADKQRINIEQDHEVRY